MASLTGACGPCLRSSMCRTDVVLGPAHRRSGLRHCVLTCLPCDLLRMDLLSVVLDEVDPSHIELTLVLYAANHQCGLSTSDDDAGGQLHRSNMHRSLPPGYTRLSVHCLTYPRRMRVRSRRAIGYVTVQEFEATTHTPKLRVEPTGMIDEP